MMNNIVISEKSKEQWLKFLPNKIYKILPIYETESKDNYKKYLYSLILRTNKFNELCDGILNDIVLDLMVLKDDKIEFHEIRKIVLDDTSAASNIYKELYCNE